MGWEGQTAGITDPAREGRAPSPRDRPADRASADACRSAGLPVAIVSCGGTGTYWITTQQPGVTEIQAGGGIFCDVHYRKRLRRRHPYALTVMTTVISRPTPNRIICDAGKKTMSSDASMPEPLGLGAVRAARLSAEHGTIELDEPERYAARRRPAGMDRRLLRHDGPPARGNLRHAPGTHRSRLADRRSRQDQGSAVQSNVSRLRLLMRRKIAYTRGLRSSDQRSMDQPSYRIGFDIGGTFTDFILLDAQRRRHLACTSA